MRCDILPSWSVDSSGRCKRILCGVKFTEGCAIIKHRRTLTSKLMGLAEQEADIMRKMTDEVS